MTELRHLYTMDDVDTPRFNAARDYYKSRLTVPFVLHSHLLDRICDGNCPIFNAPSEEDLNG